MTKITLVTNNKTPEAFEPQQGQIFQVYQRCEDILVMYTDDDSIVFLTGSSAGYVDTDTEDFNLTNESLVATLEITATRFPNS